ncbi:MAG: beta-lactamase family protein [Chitinophagales bacterium]|nr:beta-lactamase family protein [Chitinophagales bacterium]MDW8418793.1 serine hydrolase domain-containing protein [Chitinophagales bacterium]
MKKQFLLLTCLLFVFRVHPSLPLWNVGDGDAETPADITSQQRANLFTAEQLAQIRVSEWIDSFYARRAKHDGFNGVVMIAKNGQIIYSNAFGYSNLETREPLTLQSSLQLASVSKTFTAAAVLLLAEQGFFSLDDTLCKFIPNFPYKAITIKHLLTHRSGLPEYTHFDREYFNSPCEYLSNSDVLNMLARRKPALRYRPGYMFHYCNTNYVLLAALIEEVTQMSYAEFMQRTIFEPLGMQNTFVFDPDNPDLPVVPTYDTKGKYWSNNMFDGVTGDKGIYASAEDLLKWDIALRSGLLLKEETLQDAYTPHSTDRYSFAKDKDKNYGYGWRLLRQPDRTYLVYHNGNWHGANNVFARDIDDGYTVIVLGNKSNPYNYWTQPVWTWLQQLKTLEHTAFNP